MEAIFNLEQVAKALNGKPTDCDMKAIVKGVSTDTRTIKEGDLFFALIGETDGHRFVEKAISANAVCCVVNVGANIPEGIPIIEVEDTGRALLNLAAAYKSAMNVPAVAVTGSVGKTSTRDMLGCVLSQKYKTLVTEGNFNNEIGVPLTLFRLSDSHEMAVIEMGMSHFGELSRITACVKPDTAVITNVGEAHMENLGDRDGILKAKLEVLEGLSSDGTVVLCGDNDKLWSVNGTLKFETVYCGIKNIGCDLIAENIRLYPDGSEFMFAYDGKEYKVRINVPGEHHVYNALVSIIVGIKYNVPMNDIIEGIKEFIPSGMRQAAVRIGNYTVIKDCYNASPTSMKSGLSVLALSDVGKRKVACLGDMLELGSISDDAHYKTGLLAAESKIDCLITVGERAKLIAKGAEDGGMDKSSIYSFADKESLYKELYNIIKSDDLILLKASRYMKLEEIAEFMEKSGKED